MAQALATAQVNARLERSLKTAGDEAMAAAGISPSEAVRALWSLAASCKNKPAELIAALYPKKAEKREAQAEAIKKQRLALIAESEAFVEGFYAEMGPCADAELNEPSYDELKALAFADKYGSEMGWED